MKHLLTLALAAVFAGLWTIPARAANVPAPTLRIVTVRGYQVGIAGTFQPGVPVAFSLQAGPWTVGREIVPASHGRFLVGIRHLNPCTNPVARATDIHLHVAELRFPAVECLTRPDPSRPVLTVLRGRNSPGRLVVVRGIQPRSVSLRLGDRLQFREGGISAPAFTPSADATHLAPLSVTREGACATWDTCTSGFIYTFVAVHTGETNVDMSAACRQARPPCMMPDFAIHVSITP